MNPDPDEPIHPGLETIQWGTKEAQEKSKNVAPSPGYSILSEKARKMVAGENSCAMFCGGKKCKYCTANMWREDQMAINGLFSHWVTDNILAMARPSNKGIKEFNLLGQFEQKNIKTVINLQMAGEHANCGEGNDNSGFSYNPQVLMENKIYFYNYGWEDYGITSLHSLLDMVKVMQFAVTEGKVAIHCHAGLGRTGLLIACYLVFNNRMTAAEAIHFTRSKRPGAIQTSQQMKTVYNFEEYLMPFRVIFPSRKENFHEFSLKQFLARQQLLLHGFEARKLKFIPKVVYVCCERLLEMANKGQALTRVRSAANLVSSSTPTIPSLLPPSHRPNPSPAIQEKSSSLPNVMEESHPTPAIRRSKTGQTSGGPSSYLADLGGARGQLSPLRTPQSNGSAGPSKLQPGEDLDATHGSLGQKKLLGGGALRSSRNNSSRSMQSEGSGKNSGDEKSEDVDDEPREDEKDRKNSSKSTRSSDSVKNSLSEKSGGADEKSEGNGETDSVKSAVESKRTGSAVKSDGADEKTAEERNEEEDGLVNGTHSNSEVDAGSMNRATFHLADDAEKEDEGEEVTQSGEGQAADGKHEWLGTFTAEEILNAMLAPDFSQQILEKAQELETELNDSDLAWNKLVQERRPEVISMVLWDWLDQLKEPVLIAQELNAMESHASDPKTALLKIEKSPRCLLEYLLRVLGLLRPQGELRRRMLHHLLGHLTHQVVAPSPSMYELAQHSQHWPIMKVSLSRAIFDLASQLLDSYTSTEGPSSSRR